MLDADMMVMKDLHLLLEKGGDIQVCARPSKIKARNIGSFFFSINHEKSLPFIEEWRDLTQQGKGKGAHESPALTKMVKKYQDRIDIIELSENEVNKIEYPPTDETTIVHFKGGALHNTFESQFNSRVLTRDGGSWKQYTTKYLT